MTEPFHRHRLFPDYKANRRGATAKRLARSTVRKDKAPDPELIFSCLVPEELATALVAGKTPILGVSIEAVGSSKHLRAAGHGRDWVLTQAASFLRSLVPPGHWSRKPISGTLSCAPHPGSTLSGPLKPGYSEPIAIDIASGDRIMIISRSSMRPLIHMR